MMTDPISDMLTRIRNAAMARKAEVVLPYSKVKHAIAKILLEAGYVSAFEKAGTETHPELSLNLKYDGRTAAIRSLTRVSKPGRRVYSPCDRLPRVLSGHGLAIVSTSQGIMTNMEARKRRLGGEVLCEIA